MNMEKEVAVRVEFLRQAMLSADREKLAGIPMPGLTYGHSNGRLETADEFVEAIAGGLDTFLKLEFSKQTICVEGDTTVVRHVMDGSSVKGGESSSFHVGVLQVWKKTDTGWKLLARQAYKIS
jgi:hypothetical protein